MSGGSSSAVVPVIRPAEPGDVGELLTLQRAAYVAEAQLYGDPFIPALVESLEQMQGFVRDGTVVKASVGDRIAGAVRARVIERTCVISRLFVAPDLRGRRIGAALVAAVEAGFEAEVYSLSVGHQSESSLRLFRRLGYRETGRERVDDHLFLVQLRKGGRDGADRYAVGP
ncbi:GNAT family N-acetyltransferase [Rhizohabitans arisaemae]|uniref:GNAT family N-acetyltransferase n=1 Tax=Rhizohabitans arisaemae TaxID=2720610 RepID=UPI0024B1ABA8|nr:GNAT family N-acetyltransferase [Rhizohabitans arisaemae]